MRVPGHILEHLVRAGERGLGRDDPLRLLQSRAEQAPGRRALQRWPCPCMLRRSWTAAGRSAVRQVRRNNRRRTRTGRKKHLGPAILILALP